MSDQWGVHVDKTITIPIHEQIYLQLKSLILVGILDAGLRLPSVRQMSDLINVNRHTIAKVYNKLEAEQLVETFASSGTFVKSLPIDAKLKDSNQLLEIIQNAFKEGYDLGFESSEIMSVAYTTMLKHSLGKKRGLFIECNPYALSHYVLDVERETSLAVDGRLLEELTEENLGELHLDDYDVIMTTMGHYAEVKERLAPYNVYALNFDPYLSVVRDIRQLEPESVIAILCLTEHGSDTLRDVLVDLGIPNDRLFSGNLENRAALESVMNKADVLVVSKYALLKDRDLFEMSGKKIIEYRNVLQKSSVQMLEQVMARQDKARTRHQLNNVKRTKQRREHVS